MNKVTNLVLQGLRDALNNLNSYRLPVKGSFKVVRLVREVNQALLDMEAVRQQLLDEHGEKDAEGKLVEVEANGVMTFKIRPEVEQDFNDKYSELLKLEVDIPVTLGEDDFGQVEIPPGVLLGLEPVIQF